MKTFTALVLLLALSCVQARTLIVDERGSGDVRAFDDAIAQAENGDGILLMPGNYSAAAVHKSLNISGRQGAVISGSLVVAAPGCKISDIIFESDGNPAVSLAPLTTVYSAATSLQSRRRLWSLERTTA